MYMEKYNFLGVGWYEKQAIKLVTPHLGMGFNLNGKTKQDYISNKRVRG